MNHITTQRPVIRESMRIGGKKVDADGVVPVHYPYTNEVIGTVPAGRAEHAARAFEIASKFRSKLTRYERQQILFRTAELIRSRKEQLSDLITLELGLSKKDSLYECGRAYDVFTLAGQLAILDDGQVFSCDLTPHGKPRKIFTMREPVRVVYTPIDER
jgi:acyl-CoA reductase-like NAD-dependent aldehyde dehydrogenase